MIRSNTGGHHHVIVGGGIAGLTAARAAREADPAAQITLVSAECQPPYYRPDLSKAFLLGDRAGTHPEITSAHQLAETRIGWKSNWRVEEIDLARGRLSGPQGAIEFDHLLLAPGALPVSLPVAGRNLAGIFSLRSLDDGTALRAALPEARQIVIVGAGLIGLELAATLCKLGKSVYVVERAARALERCFPTALAEAVTQHHCESAMHFLFNTDVTGFTGTHALHTVETTAGPIAADLAIVAVGARPDMRLALLIDIECDDGILVDARCRTSASNVFAAGDAVRMRRGGLRLEAWRHAQNQGDAAGRNLVGGEEIYRPAPWFWSDQGELHLQGCGVADAGAQEIIRYAPDGRSRLVFQLTQGRLVAGYALSISGGAAADLPFLTRLVEAGVIAEPDELADPAMALKALWRRSKAAPAPVS